MAEDLAGEAADAEDLIVTVAAEVVAVEVSVVETEMVVVADEEVSVEVEVLLRSRAKELHSKNVAESEFSIQSPMWRRGAEGCGFCGVVLGA